MLTIFYVLDFYKSFSFLKHFDKLPTDSNAMAKTIPFMVDDIDFERTKAASMRQIHKNEISAGTLFIGMSSIVVTPTNYR
jgi:hypothetical protein